MGRWIKVDVDIEDIGIDDDWDDSRRACDEDSPIPKLARKELRKFCRKARMTLRQSTVFEYYAVDCYPIADIAKIMSLDPDTIKQHLVVAKQKWERMPNPGLTTTTLETFHQDTDYISNWYRIFGNLIEDANRRLGY
jgi:DNA-directed RNA polymerase specialized sigma24 family protein